MSLATLASRVLGLVRSILEAMILGGGAIASQWGFAIIFPNIFRRILGEGALGTALIPLISNAETEEEKLLVRRKLGVIFFTLGLILLLITLLVSLFAVFFGDMFQAEYVRNAFKLIPLLMPYTFFICLIGIGGACLSTKRVFFLPALAGLMLNIFIIATLGYFYYCKVPDVQFVLRRLSLSVILSGIVQFIVIALLMKKYEILPEFHLLNFKRHKDILVELWQLALPGLIAGSALQLSLLIDKSIAMFISKNALPALSYSERIVYLPVGVFALSVGSVLMADMSRAAAAGKTEELIEDLQFSLRHVIFCCIPMSIFVVFFRIEIIEALFLRGNFSAYDMNETAWAMLFYCMGIPFFCSLKVITPAFFARKDMKTPMKVSILANVLNLILNLLLMFPLKQGGLALATVLAGVFNNTVLLILLHRQNFKLNWGEILKSLLKSFLASASAAAASLAIVTLRFEIMSVPGGKYINIILLMAVFGAVYFIASFLFRASEVSELIAIFKRRSAKN